jgi:hypothetical protein
MSGVLSSEEALHARGDALNRTLSRLQPLRVFVAAAAAGAAARPNVVGFTDAREMLKPFHALKYLADNYLDEYDFFFLVSDTSFVNVRRLQDLVSKLSVSHDVYMGTVAEDDSHYCTLGECLWSAARPVTQNTQILDTHSVRYNRQSLIEISIVPVQRAASSCRTACCARCTASWTGACATRTRRTTTRTSAAACCTPRTRAARAPCRCAPVATLASSANERDSGGIDEGYVAG